MKLSFHQCKNRISLISFCNEIIISYWWRFLLVLHTFIGVSFFLILSKAMFSQDHFYNKVQYCMQLSMVWYFFIVKLNYRLVEFIVFFMLLGERTNGKLMDKIMKNHCFLYLFCFCWSQLLAIVDKNLDDRLNPLDSLNGKRVPH